MLKAEKFSKFSGLRWFLAFEDLYNGVENTSKNIRI